MHGATRSERATPTATAAAADGTTGRLHRSAPSRPMLLAFTTRTATCGSGSRIAIATTTTGRRRTAPHGSPAASAHNVSYEEVPGTAIQNCSARPAASGLSLESGATAWACVWEGRLALEYSSARRAAARAL